MYLVKLRHSIRTFIKIMSCHTVLLLLACFIVISSSNSDNVYVIKTNGTKIIGRKLFTIFGNKPYVAFWKIPYAVAPIEKLRFKVSGKHCLSST